jgi:hypothetical protein
MTVNGIGTSVCGSRGDVGWGSFDAMEWFVVLYMPIIPAKSIHTFDWNGEQYRMIPIRWSLELTLRTFLGRWVWGLGVIGIILGIIGIAERQSLAGVIFIPGGIFAVGVAILAGVLLRMSDRRNQAIRRVLGALTIGSADPATFTDKYLHQMDANTKLLYGTDTYAEAVEKLLEEGEYAQAMWAARMTVALEDAREGEALTDLILADRHVIAAIEKVRQDPQCWERVMQAKDGSSYTAVRARANDDDEEIPEVGPDDDPAPPPPRRSRKRRDEDHIQPE